MICRVCHQTEGDEGWAICNGCRRYCEGCGAGLGLTDAKWHGKYDLCVHCKARSVMRGWLPERAKREDHEKLAKDVAELA